MTKITRDVISDDVFQKYAFRAHKNGTDQGSIASATYTKVTFSTEAFDEGALYDPANSKIVVPKAGLIDIKAQTYITSGVVDAGYIIAVYKNGVAMAIKINRVPTSLGLALDIAVVDLAEEGDEYEVYVNLGGAGTKTVFGPASQTFFCGHMV